MLVRVRHNDLLYDMVEINCALRHKMLNLLHYQHIEYICILVIEFIGLDEQ